MTAQSLGGETGLDPGMVRVRQRLRALRSRYPGTALTTEITHIHDQQVVVRASLALPDGTVVTAHASEPVDETGMLDLPIEQAEWRATTRSLDLLGVGDFSTETRRPTPERTSAPPPEPRQPVTQPEDDIEDDVEADADDAPVAGEGTVAEPGETGGTVVTSARPDNPPAPTPAPDNADEIDMADYTWTHLWTWARAHGVTNRLQVEERIGRTTTGLSPRDIHEALLEAGLPPD